ncbi:MAG: DNA-binding protein WhiA [Lachnospiraceae bacterium]|nr:DNA-binding protein WhiA [Lachnospiraceae bacterium]
MAKGAEEKQSFCAGIKRELVAILPPARHCRRAELMGMYEYGGQIGRVREDCYTLGFRSENGLVIKKGFTLIKKTINIETEKNLTEEELFHFLHLIDHTEQEAVKDLSERVCCRRAFVRGAFLVCGSISDPKGGYHMEFACDCEEQADFLSGQLSSLGVEAKVLARKLSYVVYIKEGSAIVELLGNMGAHASLLEMENLRAYKEIRNGVNRRVNCETSNIRKTVAAAEKQTQDIEYIASVRGLGSLPEGLGEMARVRLEHPDASLKELGEFLTPPVGKSGVNHRLRRISDLADQLREERTCDDKRQP